MGASRGGWRSRLQGRVFNSRLSSRAPLLWLVPARRRSNGVTPGLTGYERALIEMEARAERSRAATPPSASGWSSIQPLYTAGTSAKDGDLLDARFPVYHAGRGGQYTYHGPGQRVAYVMLDLKRRRPDLRAYVASLEAWLIDALAAFGVQGETRQTGSASGRRGPTSRAPRASRLRTRSPPSACGCGAGRLSTA